MQVLLLLDWEIFQYCNRHVPHFTLRPYNYHYFSCKLLMFSTKNFSCSYWLHEVCTTLVTKTYLRNIPILPRELLKLGYPRPDILFSGLSAILKAVLNKFHVFCQEKLQKVRESAKTEHKKTILVIFVFFFLKRHQKVWARWQKTLNLFNVA